jgi:UDP-2-acetamido-3-amino-2,3-dideoxy-glucuronate N-acetyltransferase
VSADVHPSAVCDPAAALGRGTRVGPFAVIEPGATVGDDVTIGSHVVVGAGAKVGDGASIGASSTLVGGVEIGPGAVVADGAVVTRSVPRTAVVAGNPARITGYAGIAAGAPMDGLRPPLDEAAGPRVVESTVPGVRLHRLDAVRDLRGSLVAGELENGLPFVPQRYFFVFDVPGEDVRGEHAHRACHQFLVAVTGRVHVIVDDGEHRQEFALDDNRVGLYMPPMVWGIQYRYSEDCRLMVLASDPYDPDDYIRDYGTFLNEVRQPR